MRSAHLKMADVRAKEMVECQPRSDGERPKLAACGPTLNQPSASPRSVRIGEKSTADSTGRCNRPSVRRGGQPFPV